jgi:hypothetical protein
MRIRIALAIAILSLSTCGCAECFLESLVNFYPQGYTDSGGPVEQKQADLDQRIEQDKRLGEMNH